MKHALKLAITIVLASSVAAGATTPCTPIPPTEWTDHIDVLAVRSAAVAYFEQNGCEWGGLDQLNGTDGLVMDVGGHGGPADLTLWLGPLALVHNLAAGYFLDAECQRVEGSDFTAITASDLDPRVNSVTIPDTARWMVLASTTSYAANDLDVTLRSHGTECPAPKKPRKRR